MGGENRKFRLGLDIGIASVGWGVVDENENIIDAGVRLFPEAGMQVTASDRRVKRGGRRLLRRRSHRNERARSLLFKFGITDKKDYDFYSNEITPYELRVKGLNEELKDRELAIILLHLVKRRGIHNFETTGKESDEDKGTKAILASNTKRLDGKYVCEVQLENLKNGKIDLDNGLVRGKNNVFRTEDYVIEIRKILETQKIYNKKITEEFIETYLKIFENRREYYTGPGKPSPYGWEDEKEWITGLFGKCTYFPEEIRACKRSYTSELFNLLNDLNNLTIKRAENDKLTKEEKDELVLLFKNQNPTLKRIVERIGVKETDISGYRIDKKEKALFTTLETYKDINGIFNIEDRDKIDEIAQIITVYQTNDKILENIRKIGINPTDEQTEKLSKLSYSGSHSLSKKAMEIILPELLETSKNQMELFTEKKLIPYKMDFLGKKSIPKTYVDEWILSPVVKRAISQTLNVINEIHKKYGIPEEIVIEMAREKNSEEKRKRLNKLQGDNEKINREIFELMEGKTSTKKNGLFEKLKYWKEQNGICLYSGKVITRENLINNPEGYEIDHIIPRSISFDDSRNNKVLVLREENQQKKICLHSNIFL